MSFRSFRAAQELLLPHLEKAERDDVKTTEYTKPAEEGEREAEGADIELNELFNRADPRKKFRPVNSSLFTIKS